MKVKLGDVVQLRFGFYSKPEEGGNAAYLQVRHFDDWGKQSYNIDSFLSINQKNEAHLLKEGDILLVGKRAKKLRLGISEGCWSRHCLLYILCNQTRSGKSTS